MAKSSLSKDRASIDRKYGKVETKNQLTSRLAQERGLLKRKSELERTIKEKSPDAFHFEYYSFDRSMKKTMKLSLDDLKKKLKLVESEILRSTKKIESTISSARSNAKILFDEFGNAQASAEKSNVPEGSGDISSDIYRSYIVELKAKRTEILDKIDKINLELK